MLFRRGEILRCIEGIVVSVTVDSSCDLDPMESDSHRDCRGNILVYGVPAGVINSRGFVRVAVQTGQRLEMVSTT